MAAILAKEGHYLATMEAFQSSVSLKAVEKMFDFVEEMAAHVMTNMFKGGRNAPPLFRVLGVGSGDGRIDLRILDVVLSAIGCSKIHATILEPDVELMARFRSRVSPFPMTLEGKATFEWHEMTLEKFMESSPQIQQFDLIHFVASLYYMDAEQALRNCYARLASGGAIFCTLVAEESFFSKLARKLKGKINLGSIDKFYTEVDIESISKRNNWNYEELKKCSSDADITSCFDHSSTTGGLLLDFLTHCQDFRGTVDKMLYKEVMNFLEEQSFTYDSGRKLIKTERIAVVIYK